MQTILDMSKKKKYLYIVFDIGVISLGSLLFMVEWLVHPTKICEDNTNDEKKSGKGLLKRQVHSSKSVKQLYIVLLTSVKRRPYF